MNKDYIVSGIIKRVIRDKYKEKGYVLLLGNAQCEDEEIGDIWVKFSSIRLSKIFYNSAEEEITLQIEGSQDEENNYKFYRIIDIVDDGNFESDASYLKELLTEYSVNRVNIKDIYFRYTENGDYVMGIITNVRGNEVKLFNSNGSDWWYLSELNNLKDIYRIKDIEVIKELMKFSNDEDDTLLEAYLDM